MATMQQLLRSVLRVARLATREARRARRNTRQQQAPPPGNQRETTAGAARGGYAGDFAGTPTLVYEPVDDERPDPGEVVWAWVPYEEDHSQGKDRPVLVIGRDEDLLLALQMSSQDHDQDAEDEARWGRYWVDVGSGAWDTKGRPSEARVDRILRLDPDSIRRIGAVLDRERFDEVAAGVRQHTS
ncbi:type II toxin-antitoxin system PemK/MazF family toxin [Ornithinimicrobium faecis]|uniref:Type II toxin-antitoxin system PemK/MazF family toxin n=1 Tax=Ornithinimicrobium faecis TaxID=2934158 RepID=A0ABY4YPM9_9MICO|nr:type II toxin-antitoxin system PemK/MazF family toxin [Ornithinimicrobium sp. HY1793]USQ78516.1 type II toxin-antitoxin system PemK/MazF family toxin [Ornithinimicrobium sp. HY1793]